MLCPQCNKRCKVVNSSHRGDGAVHRKHFCHRCNAIFFTREEVVQGRIPMYKPPLIHVARRHA